MSKQIIVVIPDNFNIHNCIERIKSNLGDEVVVTQPVTINNKLGDTLILINEVQKKLKELV